MLRSTGEKGLTACCPRFFASWACAKTTGEGSIHWSMMGLPPCHLRTSSWTSCQRMMRRETANQSIICCRVHLAAGSMGETARVPPSQRATSRRRTCANRAQRMRRASSRSPQSRVQEVSHLRCCPAAAVCHHGPAIPNQEAGSGRSSYLPLQCRRRHQVEEGMITSKSRHRRRRQRLGCRALPQRSPGAVRSRRRQKRPSRLQRLQVCLFLWAQIL